MKIVTAEAIPIRIPLIHPFTIALGTLTHTNHVLVRMVDDEGRVGWGETTTFHSVYGYDQKSLYHTLTDHLIPAVLEMDPRNLALLHHTMDQALPFNLMAKCGIDLAAWDLLGQAAGVSVHLAAGGRRVNRVPLTAAVGIGPLGETAERAAALVKQGFRVIKIKIGLDADRDLERVKTVREAVGKDIRLRVDGNQGYDRKTALRVLRPMEPLNLEWIEQPLPHWDLEGLALLSDRLDTPIAVDESVYTPEDAQRVISERAAGVVNIKLPKCGGIYRAQKIAAICESAGIPCFLGGCLETTPGTAAQAHFYAATPNVISAAEMEGPWCYRDDVVKKPLMLTEGHAELPDSPGMGVAMDETKVAHYRVDF